MMMNDKNRPKNERDNERNCEWEYECKNEEEYEDIPGEWDDLLEEDGDGEYRRGKPVFKIAAVIILLAFVAFSYAWLPYLWPPHLDFFKQDRSLSEEELVRQCKPAVVNIETTKAGAEGRSQGTGFNLDPQGLIVTNRHVVEGAAAVEVTFSEEERYFSRDIEIMEGYDLAVVKLEKENLPVLAKVNSQLVELGQTVTIIGNPRGFQRVSARGQVREYYQTETGSRVFTIAAAIAPGSSGSPVLDEKGQLVGIIYATGTVKLDGEEHERAFAIPASALAGESGDG